MLRQGKAQRIDTESRSYSGNREEAQQMTSETGLKVTYVALPWSSTCCHITFFYLIMFLMWTTFYSPYRICYDIASVFCFGFWAARHVGS